MKRKLIYAALSVCLLLSGCGSKEQPSVPDPAVPEEPAVVEPAPAEEGVSQPVEEPEVPEEPVEEETPYVMAHGVWLALTDVGYSNYYHFDPETCSGRYVNLEYGLGMPFTYRGSEEELVFSLEGHEEISAVVEHIDAEHFNLIWSDSLPEKLSFVGEGDLEDFPFYSNAQLCDMALEHYAIHSGASEEDMEGMTVAAMTNVDNTVTVQLYQNLGDHNSTAAWYVVDRFTATGTDLTSGEEVDLVNCRMEVEEPIVEEPGEEILEDDEEEPVMEAIPASEEPAAILPGQVYAGVVFE